MKCCVIGVGRFGYHVATTLANNGMEVLAVDSNESVVASIRDQVTQAICMNVTSEESLRSIGVEDMDIVIVAMGENVSESILVTALLKQRLKIPKVIVRSVSLIHKDILTLIGADQVVLPEQEMGIHLADSLSLPFTVLERITSDFSLSMIRAPRKYIGKTLEELDLPTNAHVICIGYKNDNEILLAHPSLIITEYMQLIVAGSNKNLQKLVRS